MIGKNGAFTCKRAHITKRPKLKENLSGYKGFVKFDFVKFNCNKYNNKSSVNS